MPELTKPYSNLFQKFLSERAINIYQRVQEMRPKNRQMYITHFMSSPLQAHGKFWHFRGFKHSAWLKNYLVSLVVCGSFIRYIQGSVVCLTCYHLYIFTTLDSGKFSTMTLSQ